MSTLRGLIANPGLEAMPSTAHYVLDVATLLSDSVTEDVRKHLANEDTMGRTDDVRGTFIFGGVVPPDGWLTLMRPENTVSASERASSSHTQAPPLGVSQAPYHSQALYHNQEQSSQDPLQRPSSQQQLQQTQSQAQDPGYPPYPQPQKMPAQQLQRTNSIDHGGQVAQLQQSQHMQPTHALAQQRGTLPSSSQQQQTPLTASQPPTTGMGGVANPDKVEMQPTPFAVNRWEMVPDNGENPAVNETAISLSLFGARRV